MKKLCSNTILWLLVCAGITLSYFLPALISGKIPIPSDDLIGLYHPWRDQSFGNYVAGHFPVKNPLITDPVLQTYPWRYLVIKNLSIGNLPLWNPYSFSGQPLMANIQSAPLQILNLFFIFPFKGGWAAQVIFPLIINTVFMFLFLSNIKNGNKLTSKKASVFGAVVLSFSGFYVAWLEWGTIITTAMWLPLILLSLEKLSQKINGLWFLVLTFAFFQTTVSGHSQTGFYVILAAFLYLTFKIYKNLNLKYIFLVTLSLFFALAIAAPQIIPSLEFMNLSSRGIDQAYYPNRQDWFLPLQNLIQLIAPDFFGNPSTFNYWGIWNYAEFVAFVGIVPLFLVILTIFQKPKTKLYFIVLLGLSLILATENFVSKIPYIYNLPFIASFQPSRIIFLLVFSLSAIAALGLDYLLEHKINLKKLIIPALIFSFLALLLFITKTQTQLFTQTKDLDGAFIAGRNLYFPLLISSSLILIVIFAKFFKNKSFIFLLLFVLTLIDLFRFSYKFTSFSKFNLTYPSSGTLSFLQSQHRPFRIITTDRRIFHPNTSSVYGIESVDGYDPLYLKDYAKFVTAWQSNSSQTKISSFNRIVTPQKSDSPLIDLLNVKYVLTFDTLSNPNLIEVYKEGETKIYENKNFLPRAFFLKRVTKTPNREEELANILKTADYSNGFSKDIALEAAENNSSVIITNYKDQSVSLQTSSKKEAPLILTNVNYPGWNAYIDNQKTRIYEADYLFQLIIVPPGEHKINFVYQPSYVYPSVYVSLFGIGFTILVSLLLWKRKFL